MSEVENNETPVENEPKDYVEDGKNKMLVKCKYCGSKILDKKSADYMILEVKLKATSMLFIMLLFHIKSFPFQNNAIFL